MILVVSLSPAWQRTLHFQRLALGAVNRASRVDEYASGKGVNVARVAGQLGAEVKLLTALGGERGARLARSLKAQRISARIVRCAAQTRICQTLLDAENATELVEETAPLSPREVAAVFRAFDSELRGATTLVLIGSAPRGVENDFYAKLIARASRRNIPALVDAQGELLLRAVRAKPFLVHVNRAELAAATGHSRALSLSQTFTVAQQLVRLGANWVVVSDGANDVAIASRDGCWTITPPKIRAVNPIGSGDAMLAGIACQLQRGQSAVAAACFGVACGAANALTPIAGSVSRAMVAQLTPKIRCRQHRAV